VKTVAWGPVSRTWGGTLSFRRRGTFFNRLSATPAGIPGIPSPIKLSAPVADRFFAADFTSLSILLRSTAAARPGVVSLEVATVPISLLTAADRKRIAP
jgi:hypothetical protein